MDNCRLKYFCFIERNSFEGVGYHHQLNNMRKFVRLQISIFLSLPLPKSLHRTPKGISSFSEYVHGRI